MTTREKPADNITESAFQSTVIELAQLRGWKVHHQRSARTKDGWRSAITGDAGWPDLALVRRGRLIFAELKTEKGRVTPDQAAWLDALSSVSGVSVFIWRPSHWPEIEEALQ